jgi:RNA polymerase sigma factor (sigma-70 family)
VSEATKPARIYIVDDDSAVRDSVGFLVGSVGYDFVACANGDDLLRALDDEAPACIVLDVRLPGASGLELQRELAQRGSCAAIIFITGHGDVPKAVRAMREGAVDFLEKPFDDQALLDRIADALALSRRHIETRAKQARMARKLSGLTEREREILSEVVAGKSSKAIANQFGISVKTVENHRHNLMTKANVSSVSQLIAWAKE